MEKVHSPSDPGKETTKNRIYRVCITGGPYSGKTSSLSHIIDRLSSRMLVYTIPEIFSMTTRTGYEFNPHNITIYELAQFNVKKNFKEKNFQKNFVKEKKF